MVPVVRGSRLAADLVNLTPIMLLWPLRRRMMRVWGGLPEGSFLETLAELAAAAGAIWLVLPDLRVLVAGLHGGAI